MELCEWIWQPWNGVKFLGTRKDVFFTCNLNAISRSFWNMKKSLKFQIGEISRSYYPWNFLSQVGEGIKSECLSLLVSDENKEQRSKIGVSL